METAVTWEDVEQELSTLPYPDETHEIFVFGAGFQGQITVSTLRTHVCTCGGIAFCDNDPQKWNTEISGLPCVSPQALLNAKRPFALVASLKNYSAIREQLSGLGIPCCTIDAYIVRKHLPEFQRVYRLLDEESRRIYTGVLLCRIRSSLAEIRDLCCFTAQYFALPEFRFCGTDEVFVDCGAFTGEDAERFLQNQYGVFKKIYAFEGNPAALEKMKRRMARQEEVFFFNREDIVYERKFVSSQDHLRIPFYMSDANAGNGSAVQITENAQWVETVSLDRYFSERGEERITFLKADIEGAEWDMLHGAKQTIQRCRPKIAVCIYHNIYDFFRIPLLLQEWVPEYHFAVRHHWNSFDETVLYCYV